MGSHSGQTNALAQAMFPFSVLVDKSEAMTERFIQAPALSLVEKERLGLSITRQVRFGVSTLRFTLKT